MKYESQSVYRPTSVGENVSFSNTSAQSAVLRGGVYTLSSEQAYHVVLGDDPTATASHMRVPANTLLYVRANEGEKFAVVRDTTDGTLNIVLQQ